MVTNYAEIVKRKISEIQGETTPPDSIKSAVYLFLSLDLVNSTEFKSKCDGWPGILESFFSNADREVKKISDVQSWKFVGDEVLFYKKINSILDLEEALIKSLDAVRTVSAQVKNAQLVDDRAKHAPSLSVKGTAWVGKAASVPHGSNRNEIGAEHRNLVVPIRGPKDMPLIDFLGPDIDTGFRVSKYAHSNLMAISAELARVLMKKGSAQTAEMLRIVGHQQLKGVWGNRHYPIVWFSDKWRTPDELFQYDEQFGSDLVATAIAYSGKTLGSDALDRAFNEVGHHPFNQEILAFFDKKATTDDSDELAELSAVDALQLEVHSVAVCFRADGKVLIGKRPDDKSVMPGKWEFGCAQLTAHRDFFDVMSSQYKADFGARLDFPHNDPIARYFVTKSRIPGVIFIATVKNPEEIEQADWKKKHSDIRWIDPTHPGVDETECVPDFLITLKKANAAWKNIKETIV